MAEHKNAYARTAQEHKLFITDKTPRKNVWLADPQGLAVPGYGLCLSATDMAKLGQLCLQNGTRHGHRYSDRDRANAENQTAADPHPFREYRQTFAQVAADTERDNYMSAEEALAYGLIDKIIDKR